MTFFTSLIGDGSEEVLITFTDKSVYVGSTGN